MSPNAAVRPRSIHAAVITTNVPGSAVFAFAYYRFFFGGG